MEIILEIISLIREVLLTISQTFRVWDIIDILIITFLVYRVLSYMQKTSASSVIKGIVLILFVAWAATVFEMTVLSFVMRQVVQMGIVVLVVLFQPELRKLFEQVGSRQIGFFFRKRIDSENVENVITSVSDAVESMSAEPYTGALIVFERQVGLNDYAVTGIKVDAQVSSDLLQSIFYHNSPLHDGAVLLRDGRLLAAACMLPLSNNINLSRDLGMRHRAAAGISERSDAVAVVVSEQTGSISVAIDGMLKRNLSKDTLEMLLRNELKNAHRVKKDNKKKDKALKKSASKQKEKRV
jgi:diadenylate cyclase